MPELKPCPFCGGEAHLWRWNGGVQIECKNWRSDHHVAIAKKTDDEVIQAWNRRITDSVGVWKHTDGFPHRVYCSKCYATYLYNQDFAQLCSLPLHPSYCPNCGANMRGGNDDG